MKSFDGGMNEGWSKDRNLLKMRGKQGSSFITRLGPNVAMQKADAAGIGAAGTPSSASDGTRCLAKVLCMDWLQTQPQSSLG